MDELAQERVELTLLEDSKVRELLKQLLRLSHNCYAASQDR